MTHLGFGLLVRLCADYIAFAAAIESRCDPGAEPPVTDRALVELEPPELLLVSALYLRPWI